MAIAEKSVPGTPECLVVACNKSNHVSNLLRGKIDVVKGRLMDVLKGGHT